MSRSGTLSKDTIASFFPAVSSSRPYGNRPQRRYYLIVCEGEKTEPNYFEAIRKILPKEMVNRVTIEGTGRNTLSLINYANLEIEKRKQAGGPPYYHIWLVFDRDSFNPDDFDNAIQCIEQKSSTSEKWHAAWSNEAFELWYILHFRTQTGGALSREAYQDILESEMGRPYKKNAPDMFELICDRTPQAIRRAETARKLLADQPFHSQNPATTVHRLVNQLLGYL